MSELDDPVDAYRYAPFVPRTVSHRETIEIDWFRLKVYTVACESTDFDASRFENGLDLIRSALRSERARAGRPGVGFMIQHQGLTGDYLVLAWWDRENELPLRVWVRQGHEWRVATDGESICVWDLEIIWYERNLWIETALAGRSLHVALPEYLSRHFQQRNEIA